MKIRQRLAFRFMLVSAMVTGVILVLIFVLTRGFVHADFVERLSQQSRIEVLHFATPNVREVLPGESFLLVNPNTAIYSDEGKLLYSYGAYEIPQTWIDYLIDNSIFTAERGEYTTTGRKYEIDGKKYLVFVSGKDLPGQHELDILVKTITAGWLIGLVFSYVAGLYFSGNALQPVNRVVNEVNQITEDNLSYRLKLTNQVTKADEVDELILTFNALLTRIEKAFIAQKRFVQNASHELKTPLTAIMAEAELALARDRSKEEYQRTLEAITQETERLVTTTQGLLTLARLEEGGFQFEIKPVDVQALIDETLAAFKLHHPANVVENQSTLADTFTEGNAQLLQTALLNILDNAAKYSTDKIILNTRVTDDYVRIGIQDFGIGIPASEMDRLYSPLFRGSNARNIAGAGLGLPLVHRIITVHSGNLDISSEEGKGTYCEITLPLAQRSL